MKAFLKLIICTHSCLLFMITHESYIMIKKLQILHSLKFSQVIVSHLIPAHPLLHIHFSSLLTDRQIPV